MNAIQHVMILLVAGLVASPAISAEEPQTTQRLKAMLHRWRANVSAEMMEPNAS